MKRRTWILSLVCLTAALAAVLIWREVGRRELTSAVSQVRHFYLQAEYEGVQAEADRLLPRLVQSSDRDQVQLWAARSSMELDQPEVALRYLDPATFTAKSARVESSRLRAEVLHYGVCRWREAERAYLDVLQLDPDAVSAREELVRLLAICGRRREALPHLQRLVQQHRATDLLIIAARGSGSIQDAQLLQSAARQSPDDEAVLLALALQSFQSDDVRAAIEFCRAAVASDPAFLPAHVALGHYLLEAQDFRALTRWKTALPEGADAFAEVWRAKAALADHEGQSRAALLQYLEAARRGPELKPVLYRVSQLLIRHGQANEADVFSQQLRRTQELELLQDRMFADAGTDVTSLTDCIAAFRAAGRHWEANGWAQLGQTLWPNNVELHNQPAELSSSTDAIAATVGGADWQDRVEQLIQRTEARQSGGMLADVAGEAEGVRPEETDLSVPLTPRPTFRFQNDATATGLEFQFVNGTAGPLRRTMDEFTGGGIGIIDVDGDDYPDVILPQGLIRGADSDKTPPDALFRNQRGTHFVQCAAAAGLHDSGFGQGVAIGDLNNDGFPDVVIGNIGTNTVWLNQGDGTFQEAASRLFLDTLPDAWTTSVLIADLDGDSGADIYVCNYLQGEDVLVRVCSNGNGEPRACIPVHFDAAPDELYLNSLDGTYETASDQLNEIEPGKGLGLLAFAAEPGGPLRILVANDTTPNMLLTIDRGQQPMVTDTAFAAGLALNAQGKAEGSMGIASDDVNGDGRPDLFLTNFYNESNTLYLSLSDMLFDDQTNAWGLAESSRRMLGFGTQFLDLNHDGRMELFVTNGHVDDLTSEGKPYQMPAQVYECSGPVFSLARIAADEPYFSTDHLGRSVALLDWNRDGGPDVLVGHLLEPYALLTNRTEVRGNSVWLTLVGTRSSRDAVGSIVSWSGGVDRATRQLTSGDGYMASNQRGVWLGCGELTEVSDLTIAWPSGVVQKLPPIAANTMIRMCEGRERAYVIPR